MTNVLQQPDEVKETLMFLNYVGDVTGGKKLFFAEKVYVGKSDYYFRYRRYIEGECIENQLVFLKKLFNSYIKLKNGYDGIFTEELNSSFKKFCIGLCTLSITYQTNVNLNTFCDYVIEYRKRKVSEDQ